FDHVVDGITRDPRAISGSDGHGAARAQEQDTIPDILQFHGHRRPAYVARVEPEDTGAVDDLSICSRLVTVGSQQHFSGRRNQVEGKIAAGYAGGKGAPRGSGQPRRRAIIDLEDRPILVLEDGAHSTLAHHPLSLSLAQRNGSLFSLSFWAVVVQEAHSH
ncbi:unnamed protein product, partial [Musa acuminata subsp. burmannicoides]